MRSTNFSLDDPVSRAPRRKLHLNDSKAFGVEIEVENFEFNGNRYPPTWGLKPESSLRNLGIEIVSSPILFKDRLSLVQDIKDILRATDRKVTYSIRCSTHIHINVQYLTYRQVFQAMLAYYLIENLLVRTQSKAREGNLFCLRMSDAGTISSDLIAVIQNTFLANETIFNPSFVKYSACNPANIYKLGTLEFRFLSPILEPERLIFWVEVLQSLVDYGAKKDFDVIKDYDELSLSDFFTKIFKNQAAPLYEYISNSYGGYAAMTRDIHRNYDSVAEIQRILKAKKFSIPSKYWVPDLSSEDQLLTFATSIEESQTFSFDELTDVT